MGSSMGSKPQITQQSLKKLYHLPSCRAFSADHFEKKNYWIALRIDDSGFKTKSA